MSTIEITDAGPIEGTFEIDLGQGPGVYEFRGKRGSGKTTCISSIDWLSGHKVDITLHDGAASGKVEGFGAIAPIGGRKRRKGSFEPDTIDAEKFSISDILDPQGKTPEVRDATRIKALAALSETKADPQVYYDLVGGQAEFDALGITPTDDPVVLATRVKTAFDKQAREKQNTADAEAKHAAPLEHVPEGLDIEAESNLTTLGEKRDAARDELHRLSRDRETGIARDAEIVEANKRLSELQASYSGPTILAADAGVALAKKKGEQARERVAELEKELEAARCELNSCAAEYKAAVATLEAAQSHQAAVEEVAKIADDVVDYPTEGDVEEAAKEAATASAAYDQGVRVRDVQQNHAKAKSHRDAEKSATKAAEEFRNKAGEVFDLLAKSLHTKHLSIESVDGEPRLFVKHPKRGRTLFDQVNGLSDGERVDFTLQELLPHLESPGVLPIPQRVWQDLQPSDREALHDMAAENGLYLFGAQVDDGDLRVVFYGNGELATI